MRIQPLHSNFILPTRGSQDAGAFDIYMPEDGQIDGTKRLIPLGFATAIPEGHVALVLPRSGTGAKFSVELNNTTGVIDADYRGEWFASMRTKDGSEYSWNAGDRVLQFLIVPIARMQLTQVDSLDDTDRGAGGFGSSGQ